MLKTNESCSHGKSISIFICFEITVYFSSFVAIMKTVVFIRELTFKELENVWFGNRGFSFNSIAPNSGWTTPVSTSDRMLYFMEAQQAGSNVQVNGPK